MRPNPTRLGLTKFLALLSATVILACAAGTRQPLVEWASTPLGILKARGRAAFDRGDFEESARLASFGLSQAPRRSPARLVLLQLLAVDRMAQFRYAEALKSLLQAERLAALLCDRTSRARIASNLSNLYLTLGDFGAARTTAERALEMGAYPYEAELRLTAGRGAALHGDRAAGEANLLRAIELLEQSGNGSLSALALDEVGSLRLAGGDMVGAENALSAAFRRHLLLRDSNLAYSYLRLAALRLRMGDPQSALWLNSLAVNSLGGTLAPYRAWEERGPILEALGKQAEALSCYRHAVELARRWRAGTSPSDRTQTILADGLQQSVYDRFVALSANLALKSGQRNASWEAFAALEENRASGLLATALPNATVIGGRFHQRLTALRQIELRIARQESAVLRGEADRLRAEIDQLQANTLVRREWRENFSSQNSLTHFIEGLSDSEAFFSFAFIGADCFRWSVSREGFSLQRLSGCSTMPGRITEFRNRIAHGQNAVALGSALYSDLFGDTPLDAANRHHWLISLDDSLWDLPFAALVVENRGSAVYLVERHALRTVPSAFLTGTHSIVHAAKRFVGVGDPIYNRADPRRQAQRPWFSALGAMSVGSDGPSLNRLVGSGGEVRAASRVWPATNGTPTLLTGVDATRERFMREVARPTTAIHFAAHVITPQDRKDEAMIAMGIDSGGNPDAITADDIKTFRVPGALVVMNGCSSGRGEIHPGAGLLGLTRAWLLAGADSVVASQWDMPDDSGDLFPSFYRYWTMAGKEVSVAEALRRAQVDMLRSGTWRADPGFWAAYSVMGVAK
ncbi:MAG: CHAT domain-containing protein [Bryobacteraceae bacterium]